MRDTIARYQVEVSVFSSAAVSQPAARSGGDVLVELKDVNVSYHERKVSISGDLFPAARHSFLRCCKIQAGQCEQVKGGTFKVQTVRLQFSHVFVVWMTNHIM